MERPVPQLEQRELHPALQDPVLNVPIFHTEIMSRFPDAISFAPGAPNLEFAQGFDPAKYIDRYLGYLCAEGGLDEQQARNMLYEYGPSRGLINDLVADALRRDQGIDVSPQAVAITVGAQEGMMLALAVLCADSHDLLAVVNPCFIGITGAASLLRTRLVPIAENGTGVDAGGLATACQRARAEGDRIRALYVAPDYSNPSGMLLDLPARRRLLALADEHDFLLIEDSTYGFTVAPGAEIPALKALDHGTRVIGVGTFAKICLPGARVGFVVADQPVRGPDGTVRLLAEEIAKIKGVVTLNTPAISQAVVAGMLLEHGGSIAGLGRAKSDLYRRNLGYLLDALDRHLTAGGGLPSTVNWNRPTGGFFVRMTLPVEVDASLIEDCASRFGVLWTPMSQFYLDGSGRNEIRLSCSYLDRNQIEEGVARLARFLRSLDPAAQQNGAG
jgi:(S)-3,5-dihydroxyphenylglycine transaminase